MKSSFSFILSILIFFSIAATLIYFLKNTSSSTNNNKDSISSSSNITGYEAVKLYIDKGIESEKKCMEEANSNPNTDGRQNEYSRCIMLQVGVGDVRRECADEKVSDSQTEELIKYLDEKLKTLPNCKPRE
jgi:hypothetical protein